jgi:F-type H+-transporting ATPase subunit alpha
MGISLYAATAGHLDDVDVSKIGAFEAALHAYLNSNHKDLADKINVKGDLNDDIMAGLKDCVVAFKANGVY